VSYCLISCSHLYFGFPVRHFVLNLMFKLSLFILKMCQYIPILLCIHLSFTVFIFWVFLFF
jgi:hypothetical protein